jgi:hypothetical protein
MGPAAHQKLMKTPRGADSQSAAPRLVSASGGHRHECRCCTQECVRHKASSRESVVFPQLRRSYLRGHNLFHNAPVKQRNAALGAAGVARIVRHHADGGAFLMKFTQQCHDGFAIG